MPSSRRTFCKTIGLSTIIPSVAFLTKPNPAAAHSNDAFSMHLDTETPKSDAYWKVVRNQFPLTKERAYFNTGGIGASPYSVINAVKSKMDELEEMGEVGRSETVWTDIKTKVAQIFGCSPSEIALTGCCTESMNIAANGISLKKGDEVLLTSHEHVGGALPWLGRQKRDGVVVKTFEPAMSAEETLERLKRAVTRRTKVISVSHSTCTTGAILPVKQICAYARERNIRTVIDGAQVVGQIPIDVKDLGCDCYATSGHKWMLGPKRTGILYVREELLPEIQPVVIGAYSDAWWSFEKGFEYHPTAQRYEYGTYNVPVMYGLGAAIDFLNVVGLENIKQHGHRLVQSAINELRDIPNVNVLTPHSPQDHASILTVRLYSMETSELQRYLAEEYRLRTRYVAEADLHALRISVHVYNNEEEVNRFIEGIRSAANM